MQCLAFYTVLSLSDVFPSVLVVGPALLRQWELRVAV